jgi:membrane protein implicated in regulation of membrane protease activity
MLTEMWSPLFAWYNLPFTIMLMLCGLFAMLQLIGLGDDSDSDLDADFDAEIDADLDLDFDADADFDMDADIDADFDADADLDVDADGLPDLLSVLAFLGVGKAPLMVVLVVLLGSMAVIGWTLNTVLEAVLGSYPTWGLLLVLPIAFLIGGLISSRVSRTIGRALPSISSTATGATGLIGRRGAVISPRIDGNYGLVRVRDQGGTLINVFAITTEEEPITGKSEVVLVEYDSEKKRYMAVSIHKK